jgi:hypothetical protein
MRRENLIERCLIAASQVTPEFGPLFEGLAFFANRLFRAWHGVSVAGG